MNRKNCKWLLAVLIGIAFTSCDMFTPSTPSFQLSDLQGLWQRINTQEYVRFTTEQSDEVGYLLGREWDESEWDDPEMTAEEYLIWNRQQLGHPVNGWFKYQFKSTGDLTEIHFMDNGGAEIPKVYIITKLSDTVLSYYEEDHKNNTFTFSKVIETK